MGLATGAPPLVTGSRLARVARSTRRGAASGSAGPATESRCELCSAPIAEEHRHLFDQDAQSLLCVCRPCSLLFDRPGAAHGELRLVPERVRQLVDFDLDDATWDALAIPVGLAYLFTSTPSGRVRAFYPGPMGATESLLGLEAWSDLVRRNPVVATMEPDVEALLVRRARGVDQQWIVPIDRCYRLVALLRTRWRGLSGGGEVWEEIDRFFAALAAEASRVDRDGRRPA